MLVLSLYSFGMVLLGCFLVVMTVRYILYNLDEKDEIFIFYFNMWLGTALLITPCNSCIIFCLCCDLPKCLVILSV